MRPKGWVPTVFPPSGSAATEALLDDWVAAKRAGDFRTADDIRDDLRREGVEPDQARPDFKSRGGAAGAAPPWRGGGCGGFPGDDRAPKRARGPSRRSRDVEEALDEWVEAKRAKDFGRADRIRE